MILNLTPSVNWLVYSSEDISEARKVLKELDLDSTVDSVGLSSPVESISNILFPATSTLHTRLRYQIFIPAIFFYMYKKYKFSKTKPSSDSRHQLKSLELWLQEILGKNKKKRDGNKKGVIGSSKEDELITWPSQTYWNAINMMGIWGSQSYSRSALHDLIDLGKNKSFKDGDEGNRILEEDTLEQGPFETLGKGVIKIFQNIISTENGRGKKVFNDKLDFSLTNKEAKFFVKQFACLKKHYRLKRNLNMHLKIMISLVLPVEHH